MKPVLFSALLLALGYTYAQAQPDVFASKRHIDDGIFVGPKKHTPQLPRALAQPRPYDKAPSFVPGIKNRMLFSGRFREPRLTLTQSLRTSRASQRRIAGLKLVSLKGSFIVAKYTFGDGYDTPSLFGFRPHFRSSALSPYPAFALRSQDSPMHNTQNSEFFDIIRQALKP